MNIFALWGEIEINRKQAEQDIKSVEKQAEKSGKKMETSFDKVSKVVGAAIKEIDKYGDKIEKFGKDLSKKAGVPLAALTALMGGLAKATADYGDRVAKQAQQIGLSVQAYQELEYAMGQNGVSTEEFEMSIGNLNQRLGMARRGNEQYRKTLEKLGFNLDELDKGAISTEESFNQIVAALADMDDGQMQAAIASDFFGTRVARRLIPAIRGGAEGIEELRQRAHDLGLVMDEEFTKRSEVFGDTMDDLSRATGGLGRAIGKELLAPFINLGKWVTDIVSGITGWIEENPKLVRQIIIWGGAIAGVLGALTALGTTLIVTGKIVGALGTIFNLLISKPMLIIAAIGLLYLAWENDWLGIRTTTEQVVNKILELWNELTTWWETSDFGQAVRDAWADIVAVWTSDELTLPQKVIETVSIVANTIADLIPSIRAIWDVWTDDDLSLGQKVINTVSIVVNTVADLIESINIWWTGQVVKLARKTAELLGLDPDEAWFVQLAEDLNATWTNEDLTFGEKIIESLKLIPGAQVITDFIDDVKDKIVNSKAWQWTVDVALPVIVDGGETVIKAVVEVGGELYDAIKKGLDTGDWGPFWGVASDIWSQGVVLAITLSGAALGAGKILDLIKTGLGVIGAGLSAFGIPGLIGVLTVGIQLMEAIHGAKTFKQFGADLVLALAAGIGIGMFTGSPYTGALAFTLVMNLELGSSVYEDFIILFEWLSDNIKKIFTGQWGELLSLEEFMRQKAELKFVEETYAKNLANAVKWLREEISEDLWDDRTAMASRYFDVDENDIRKSLGLPEVTMRRETRELLQTAQDLASSYGKLSWEQLKYVAEERAKYLSDSPFAFGIIMDELDKLVPYSQRVQDTIKELSESLNAELTALPAEELMALVDEYKGLATDTGKYYGVSLVNVMEELLAGTHITRQEIWERFGLGFVVEAVDEAVDKTEEFKDLLDAIYKAEGGADASVPYGMTGFADAGNKFNNERNQALFEELAKGLEEGSEEYYRAAVSVSVQHYWNTFQQQFPGIAGQTFDQLDPEMQQLFVLHMGRWFSPPNAHELNKNWVPNVLSILGHEDAAAEFRAGSQELLNAWIEGVYDMASDAEAAAAYIAGIFADYLVGESPPPEGPLSVIDEGAENIGEAWVEGMVDGMEENTPFLVKALEHIKSLLSGIWEMVPEDIRKPIEDMIKQAEEALFSLDDLQEELQRAITGGPSVEDEAQSFMDRLKAALNEKLKQLDEPLNRFADAVSNATLHLSEVIRAISSGDWVGAILSILTETESFAKAMELIGKLLEPTINLIDAFLLPAIEFVADTLAKVANFFIKAINGVIRVLNAIPFVNIRYIKEVKWGEEIGGGAGPVAGKGSTSGRQISEITGPTRDLLVDLLSPLANFGQIVAPIQDIRNILYERLPNFNNMDFAVAGAGAIGGGIVFESGAIVISSSGTSATELSRDMLDAIEREMARRVNFGFRGRGGR